MKLFLPLSIFCLLVASETCAAYNKKDPCQEAILKAESVRNTTIYDSCDFNDPVKAFSEWAPWAEQNEASQALYELCIRHPNQSRAERLCQKAADLGNASALLHQAEYLYQQQNYVQAAQLYAKALESPMLTNLEKGKVAQNMGLLYMNPNTNYYNPSKGLPLIKKAVEQRGAQANNLMGVYAMFGQQGVEQNAQEAFKYFWRAALLGCPAAEENLGLFFLGNQKKLPNKTLEEEMSKRMFSCSASADEKESDEGSAPSDCNCSKVLSWQKNEQGKPYRFEGIDDETATLIDADGTPILVQKGMTLPNGMKVLEVRTNAVILSGQNFNRISLEISPSTDCLQVCQKQQGPKKQRIPVYHFTFTQKECADILYYAERLVDTNLPFTGKNECGFSSDMDKASELLKNL